MTGRAAEDIRNRGEGPRVVRPVEDEYLAGPVSRGDAAEAPPSQRTRAIRDEIEQTREEMSETIDAIQEKLRPRNIVAQAKDSVRTAAGERMREMATTAGEAAGDVMQQTREAAGGLVETARQNPIPAAAIGFGAAWLLTRRSHGSQGPRPRYINTRGEMTGGDNGVIDRIKNNPIPAALAGIGLAWLAMSDSEQRSDSRHLRQASWQRGGYNQYGVEEPALGHTVGGYAASSAAYDEGSTASTISGNIAPRAQQLAGDAMAATRQTTRRAKNQLERMMEDNPLLMGAAAAALGACIGAALPETERENEWMGEARDSVVERAQTLAKDAASTVKEKVGEVAGSAGLLDDNAAKGH
jgi:ElaB/YqjD/DUF883 family membrane-anchored ribosome-binding protein